MNSLYGKFGQRSGHEEIIGRTNDLTLRVETELDVVTGKVYRIRQIAGLRLARSLDGEGRNSHPAIAAHVPGYGRMLLWRYAKIAGLENVFYCDTDSLHTNADGVARLRPFLSQSQLGSLKIEKTVKRAIYHGPKDYVLDGQTVIKGVRKSALELEPGRFQQEQWVSIRGACMISHSGGPLIRTVTKNYARVYRKGTVSETGEVSALVLGSDELGFDGRGS
jgi:hypothetical protein